MMILINNFYICIAAVDVSIHFSAGQCCLQKLLNLLCRLKRRIICDMTQQHSIATAIQIEMLLFGVYYIMSIYIKCTNIICNYNE